MLHNEYAKRQAEAGFSPEDFLAQHQVSIAGEQAARQAAREKVHQNQQLTGWLGNLAVEGRSDAGLAHSERVASSFADYLSQRPGSQEEADRLEDSWVQRREDETYGSDEANDLTKKSRPELEIEFVKALNHPEDTTRLRDIEDIFVTDYAKQISKKFPKGDARKARKEFAADTAEKRLEELAGLADEKGIDALVEELQAKIDSKSKLSQEALTDDKKPKSTKERIAEMRRQLAELELEDHTPETKPGSGPKPNKRNPKTTKKTEKAGNDLPSDKPVEANSGASKEKPSRRRATRPAGPPEGGTSFEDALDSARTQIGAYNDKAEVRQHDVSTAEPSDHSTRRRTTRPQGPANRYDDQELSPEKQNEVADALLALAEVVRSSDNEVPADVLYKRLSDIGLSHQQITREMNDLLDQKILTLVDQSDGSNYLYYRFSEDFGKSDEQSLVPGIGDKTQERAAAGETVPKGTVVSPLDDALDGVKKGQKLDTNALGSNLIKRLVNVGAARRVKSVNPFGRKYDLNEFGIPVAEYKLTVSPAEAQRLLLAAKDSGAEKLPAVVSEKQPTSNETEPDGLPIKEKIEKTAEEALLDKLPAVVSKDNRIALGFSKLLNDLSPNMYVGEVIALMGNGENDFVQAMPADNLNGRDGKIAQALVLLEKWGIIQELKVSSELDKSLVEILGLESADDEQSEDDKGTPASTQGQRPMTSAPRRTARRRH